MLRITGAVAVILSSALAVLVFTKIGTVSASGHFFNIMNPNPQTLTTNYSELVLQTAGGTKNMFNSETAPAYPGGFGFVTNSDLVVSVFVPFPDLPRECDVEISHRWVHLGGWLFGSTVLRHEGKTYVIERSPGAFFGTLVLIAVAPALLWGMGALLWLFLPGRAARSQATR